MYLYFYLASVFICFLCSSLALGKRTGFHLRFFAFIMFLTLLVEIIANYFLSYTHLKNRNSLYNLFLPVELSSFLVYYYMIFQSKLIQKILLFEIFIIIAVWIYTTYFGAGTLSKWNNNFIIIGFLCIITTAAVYCYQLFISEELIDFSKNTEFWISVALLMFYMINLPFLGMYQFVIDNFYDFAESLKGILQVSGCLMYLMIGYAYILHSWNSKRLEI